MKHLSILCLIPVAIALQGYINPGFAQNAAEKNVPLDARQKSLVAIAALTANGRLTDLEKELHAGLDAGLTSNQIKEILIHLYAYCGFPRSIRGLQTFMAVADERKAKGIKDADGPEASLITDPRSKYDRGKAILGELTGSPQDGVRTGYSAFAPTIEVFLKEHLFADIFERNVLTYQERELVTISVLCSIGGVEPMLQSHLNICLNTGLTPHQLQAFVNTIKPHIGEQEIRTAQSVLDKVLNAKKVKNMKKLTSIIGLTMSIAAADSAVGQMRQESILSQGESAGSESGNNPFHLVYEGAITENIKGKVNIRPVNYKINGLSIAANVYTPPFYEADQKYPAIVIAHPNGGVKEQVAGLYAQKLAEQGFITITADAAYQGGSDGTPRYTDKPSHRIEDIFSMGDYISQFRGVDPSRLAVLGICGGGGYTLKAAQADKRFRAVATLSMFNSGVVRRNGFMNSQLSTVQDRLKQASDARALEAAGGETLYANNNNTPLTDEQIAALPFDLYREGYLYYQRSHVHPNSSGKYTLSSLMDLMTFDAGTNMDLIHQPLLMIAGSKADTYYMTDDAFSKAVNSREKELFLIHGATHIETYWKPQYVSQAVIKLTEFFKRQLN